MIKIVIASRNQAKIREIKQVCSELKHIGWLSLLDFPDAPVVIEDGRTYRENAEKKAREAAQFTGLWALADDSGIEVDALDGKPGIHSARWVQVKYGHAEAGDRENNEKLLEELVHVPEEKRTARYRAVVVLADPQKVLCVGEGTCEGRIAFEQKGEGGFGYDPLFFVPLHGKMMAELSAETKNRISHRGMALKSVIDFIRVR